MSDSDLLVALAPVLDVAYLRRSALELGVGDLLDRAFEEADRPRD